MKVGAARRAHTQQCHKLPNQILSFPPAYVTQPFSPINVMPQWIAGCIMAIIYYSPSFRLITSECDCFNRVTAMSEPTLLHLSHVYRSLSLSLALLRNAVVYFKDKSLRSIFMSTLHRLKVAEKINVDQSQFCCCNGLQPLHIQYLISFSVSI